MGSLGKRVHRDCNAMGEAVKISLGIPSIRAQNAIISLLIVHIIPSRQIYVAINYPLLFPSGCCLTSCSYIWNFMHAADDVSHAENVQSNSGRFLSPLYTFRDGIQVTRVFRYCGERQGEALPNKCSILIKELDLE